MTVSTGQPAHLWQRPVYGVLLEYLRSLRVDPPIWSLKLSRAEIIKEQESNIQLRREVVSYLSNVIKSPLAWIGDEALKEAIWEEASRRLSERCGRAAMSEITRRWPFESGQHPTFELVIREPSLTGDSLGFKTWGSSYLLAQMLGDFAKTYLAHLLPCPSTVPPAPVLELGSGTGLLGLAAACVWKTHVVLSDLPEIMPNLVFNMEQNRPTIEAAGGQVEGGVLTWGGPPENIDPSLFERKNRFQIVLAADPLYDDNHPALLAGAVNDQLACDSNSRALIMVPQRDELTVCLISGLKKCLAVQDGAMICTQEGTVAGQDDWDEDDETPRMDCWWGIFKRVIA